MGKYRGRFTRTIQAQQEREIYVEADNHEQADDLFESIVCAIQEEGDDVVLDRYPGTAWTRRKDTEEEVIEEAEFDRNLGKKRP